MAERAWFAVECGMHKHEKMADLPSDTARLGWYTVLAEAKLQRKQGQFASEAHFRAVVGRFARYLKDYLTAKLIDRSDDGSLAVHDWQRHQWAAKKAGQREDNAGTSERQIEDLHAGGRAVTVPVPVDVYVSPSVENGTLRAIPPIPVKGMDGSITDVTLTEAPDHPDAHRLQALAEELTGQPYVIPHFLGGLGAKALNEQLRPHGFSRVEAAWRKVARQAMGAGTSKPTLRQLVLGGDNLLNPLVKVDDKEGREAEERAAFDRRVARTRAGFIADPRALIEKGGA